MKKFYIFVAASILIPLAVWAADLKDTRIDGILYVGNTTASTGLEDNALTVDNNAIVHGDLTGNSKIINNGSTMAESLSTFPTDLTFYKDYADEQDSINADYADGSVTATFTSARSASAPATYVDSSGVVQTTTTANVPRWQGGYYDSSGFTAQAGVMIEAAGENLITKSNDFEDAIWTATNVTADNTDAGSSSPDGTATAPSLTASAADSTLVLASGVTAQTFSLWMKRKTGTGAVSITADGGSTWTAVTLSASWIRVQESAASASQTCGIKIATNTDAIYVFGAQFEDNPYATSYVPTTSAALTRPAEVLKYTNATNISATNPTIFMQFALPSGASGSLLKSRHMFDTDASSTRIRFFISSATGQIRAQTGTSENNVAQDLTANQSYVYCSMMSTDDVNPNFVSYLDSTSEDTDNNNLPDFDLGTSFYVGSDRDGTTYIDGVIQALAIYSDDLNAAQVTEISNNVSDVLTYKADNEVIQAGFNGADGQLNIYSEQGTTDYGVIFKPHTTMTETSTYTLPAADGSDNYVLTTDGSGNTAWTSANSGVTYTVASSTSKMKTGADYICDGTNDEVEIQAAIDALSGAAGRIVLLEGQFNTVGNGIEIADDDITFEGQGHGATVIYNSDTANAYPAVKLTGTTLDPLENIVVRGMTIRGENGGGDGITAAHIQQMLINQCRLYDNGGDGLDITWESGTLCENPKVTESEFSYNGGKGATFNHAHDLLVNNCHFEENTSYQIHAVNGSEIFVSSCSIDDGLAEAIYLDTIDYVSIANNLIQENANQAIYVTNSDQGTISDNTIDTNGTHRTTAAITLKAGSDFWKITDNKITGQGGHVEIESDYNLINSNSFDAETTGNDYNGIQLEATADNNLVSNNYFWTVADYAIDILGTYNYIRNNLSVDNKGEDATYKACFRVNGGSQNVLSGNVSYNTSGLIDYGIISHTTPTQNRYIDNVSHGAQVSPFSFAETYANRSERGNYVSQTDDDYRIKNLTEIWGDTTAFDASWVDGTGLYAGLAIFESDPSLTLVGEDAGTWGALIDLAELDTSDATDFDNKWTIARKTDSATGSGTGDGSLNFIYGTNANFTSNTVNLLLAKTGDATLTGDLTISGSDLTLGSAGVKMTGDGDGQITFLGLGDGSDEDLSINLDDTSNRITFNSSTSGVARWEISNTIADALVLGFGDNTSTDVTFKYQTAGTNDHFQLGLVCGSTASSGYYSILEKADSGHANRDPGGFSTDPVWRIYSADVVQANDYIQLTHDQTDGNFNIGNGDLKITAQGGDVDFSNENLATTGNISVSGTTTFNSVAYTWPGADGSNGQQLTTNGSGTLSWAAAGGAGGGATYREYTLLPESAVLDDSSPPAITVVESTGSGTPRFRVADFDATTDEILYWTFVLPSDYTASSSPIVDIYWFANDTGASEDAIWAIQVSATTPADADAMTEQACDTDVATESGDVDVTEANRLLKTTITLTYATYMDSAAAGDTITIRLFRDADDSVGDADNDGLTSDARLHSVHVKIPRS